jgi:HAMP domain-containing protein
MNHHDRIRLLFGPYQAPPLRPGARAFCFARDCDVVVTSWTDGRIPWPRCRPLESHGGGSGILVDETLAFAIRHESASAIVYWWGAAGKSVAWWRRALGVKPADPEGSQRLYHAALLARIAGLKAKEWTDAELDARAELAKRLDQGRFLRANPPRPLWTAAQLRLLGKLPDVEVAKRIGRTESAVRVMRSKRGILTANDRRRSKRRRARR